MGDVKNKNKKFFIIGFISFVVALAFVKDKLGIPAFISFMSSSVFLFISARVGFGYNNFILYLYSIISLGAGISCIFLIMD